MMNFKGKDLEYYNALMKVRNEVTERMRHCADSALSSENFEKRGVTTHMADSSFDNSRNEMALRMLSEDGDIVELIDDAVERLANGEYGKCMECGEMIAEARLQVRPYALFCIKCKSRQEEMMKQR
ncbi:MAG: TraR/DksA family transcriptional regulator [Lentisphaerae bacterium]|nr:TraR/DksA family transcriptional regulator [Lentisphaerota bacterium]